MKREEGSKHDEKKGKSNFFAPPELNLLGG